MASDISYINNQEPTIYKYIIDNTSPNNFILVFVYELTESCSSSDYISNYDNNIIDKKINNYLDEFSSIRVALTQHIHGGFDFPTFNNDKIKITVDPDQQIYMQIPPTQDRTRWNSDIRPTSSSYIFARGQYFVIGHGTNNQCVFIQYGYITYSDMAMLSEVTTTTKGLSALTGTATSTILGRQQNVYDFETVNTLYGNLTEYDPDNLYPGGDDSENPGDGSFDYTGTSIPIPDLPEVSVTDSGFVRLFNPTNAQLQALGSYLWSDAFSVDSFKKIFNNPMDCILGLSIMPVNVPTSGAEEITVGNIVTTVSMNKCSKQFIKVDCGTCKVSPTKFTGSYLDYAPYTKCYIYLPFIGIQELQIDDIMNSTVHVVYHVDILTGACVAFIEATARTTGGKKQGDTLLYTFMGQCGESVPLSSNSFSQTYGSILTAGATLAGAVATVATGGTAAPIAAGLTGAAASTAKTAIGSKPSVSHSGSIGGSSGMMCVKYPYLIFDAPHTAIPSKQYKYTGYPSNVIVKLSTLSGFTVVQDINLTISHEAGEVAPTDTEMDEIVSLLKRGVVI